MTGNTPPISPVKRIIRALVLSLPVVFLGFGWWCEVQPSKSQIVIQPGMFPWAHQDTADLCLVRDGNLLHGWIDANNGTGYDLYHLISEDDGATWKNPDEVPCIGRGADWAQGHVTSPTVLLREGKWEMWYGATSDPRLAVGYQIGRADSEDGENWRMEPFPVLPLAASKRGDNFSLADPCVEYQGGAYDIWYSGAEELKGLPLFRIWHATSTDGIHWTDHRPIVKDFLLCAAPHVEHFGGVHHLWYVVANRIQAAGFQELRYRYEGWLSGLGWFPWSRKTLLTHKELGGAAAHSIYSPCVDLKAGGNGWLYLSAHDNSGVWRVLRLPIALHRTWWGIPF